MVKNMVREYKPIPMDQSMWGNLRIKKYMVTVRLPGLMEESMSGNGRTKDLMVRESTRCPMKESILGNSRVTKSGKEPNTTKMGRKLQFIG